jgi:hypothetical protein
MRQAESGSLFDFFFVRVWNSAPSALSKLLKTLINLSPSAAELASSGLVVPAILWQFSDVMADV